MKCNKHINSRGSVRPVRDRIKQKACQQIAVNFDDHLHDAVCNRLHLYGVRQFLYTVINICVKTDAERSAPSLVEKKQSGVVLMLCVIR